MVRKPYVTALERCPRDLPITCAPVRERALAVGHIAGPFPELPREAVRKVPNRSPTEALEVDDMGRKSSVSLLSES